MVLMKKIVEIHKATVCRGETRVFRGLTLEFRRGESAAVIGPNGAGKSTLLKLLTREIYPVQTHGSYVKVLGQEFWDVEQLRGHLGIVSKDLQERYLGGVPGIDVLLSGFYSSIGLWPHQSVTARQRKQARSLMEILGIGHCGEKPFNHLSAGEQRKFLLGRALIHDPDILVLDEPTDGLDVKASFQYMEILSNLIQSGKTAILVTHHIHEIPRQITRLVFLKTGKVTADGHKKDLLTSHALSRLFDTPVEVVEGNGHYQILPGK